MVGVVCVLRNSSSVFLRSVVKTPKSLAALQAQAKKGGTDRLTLEEIEAEITAVRRATPRAKT